MYIWQFAINGVVIIGRTYDEFLLLLDKLQKYLVLHDNRRLIVYVHNFSYEFQFIRKYINWLKTFNIDNRKPIYALSKFGIEFRCSYILSGVSLSNIKLNEYDVQKLVGNLDYNLKRHSGTPLSKKELDYCINDVRVLCCYIDERIQNDGNISKIPLTKTGYVREYVRKRCLAKQNYKVYTQLMKQLTITSNEYLQLKSAFAGGFTHASCLKSNKTYYNVSSYDFTSSYPSVLISEQFPMSTGKQVDCTLNEFFNYIETHCCLFELTMYNVTPTVEYEHIISQSKCLVCDNAVIDNGRVVTADKIVIDLTDVDFKNIMMFYKFDDIEINNMIIYERGYLPKPIIEAVLYFYEQKTTLKGVENRETEYNYYKELLNSIYGMIVTDIVRDSDIYDTDWSLVKGDINECITKYNTSKKRVLFYPWGVWCTAYARHNLYTGIMEFGTDYIYSDTDSLKVLNMSNHIDYINKYNDSVTKKLEQCLSFYNIDKNKLRPLNKFGTPKPLGVWTYEGTYERFKTLGAKRYLFTKENKLNITVSGVSKNAGNKLLEKYDIDKIFDLFTYDYVFDEDTCGKQTHTYIDVPRQGTIIDYLGNKGVYNELSYIHLEPTTYNMTISNDYKKLLTNIIGGKKYVK